MLKTLFINALKILVAAALIYWLINSGKLDFKLLAQLVNYPLAIVAAVVLSLLNFLLVSYRWETILRARSSVKIPLLGILQITWIGQFFSSVLPGSVSGDLVKILYVQKFDENFSKKFVFASILIDRVMGLSGLILLVGVSSLLFGRHILETAPAMGPLLSINYLLVMLVVLSLGTFFYFHNVVRLLLVKCQSIALKGIFEKLTALWDDLVMIKGHMLKAVALSVVVQFIAVLIFWSLIHPFVGGHMDFVQALAFIPIGLMTLALPVAPSGLGVGHAIFQKLFEFSGIQNGASLFNLYFVVTLVVNVLGVIPYILTKTKK
ncbi:lysylphosphatidylglycerol synthase transmembrane domain-containing protein [Peredibacter starrii]|uniref:Lysylphosphatidylglycerol synthase transmembrane domain-containing protein n=1 Tax=Peredibacter starrii TaxID=28202 RepID=A0AAX4HNX1_9BACT|nr:lysylphosphatidylglycerol synthase transmembrane domain-containing protein [Peredibacter starrii]WPU64957.1 lysylphosphatidylglycerol synthase transmembrane domain-containing protein [Peredibacter starrii]